MTASIFEWPQLLSRCSVYIPYLLVNPPAVLKSLLRIGTLICLYATTERQAGRLG